MRQQARTGQLASIFPAVPDPSRSSGSVVGTCCIQRGSEPLGIVGQARSFPGHTSPIGEDDRHRNRCLPGLGLHSGHVGERERRLEALGLAQELPPTPHDQPLVGEPDNQRFVG